MTRIFTDGAEMMDLFFWTYSDVSSIVQSSTPAISPYYYRIGGGPGIYKEITAINECYVRFRLADSEPTNIAHREPAFYKGTTMIARLGMLITAHMAAYRGDGQLLEDSGITIVKDQWYLVEIYFKLADSPDGRFVVYLDGTKIIDYTGDTKPGADTTFDRINFSPAGGGYVYVDDLALNDTSNTDGKNDNSWCGDGVIIKITPDGNGAHNNWHGNDLDDVDNYLLVDEYPKDDDTTYVYHDGASPGTQDQYAMSDYAGTGKLITRVYAEARARRTVAGDADTIKLGVFPGGADAMSEQRSLTTTYSRVVGDEYKTNPDDSNPWEEADLDSIQAVIEVGSSTSSSSSYSSSSSSTTSSSSSSIP